MAKLDPILATRGTLTPDGRRIVDTGIIIHGGLHFIRGNSKPHFSLTCDIYERGRDVGGGAAHETILREFPHLKPLADLHLSDIDGVPMHAEANGWYWLAGTVEGGFGQRHHGGNSEPHRGAAECLRVFAEHVRISHQDAVDLRGRLLALAKCHGIGGIRLAFHEWIEQQKPRWKAEANACIAALDLQVFGDCWVPEQVAA